jgi:hypothetical protein
MANTFTKIASATVGAGGASSIDFSSIPSTYTDLFIKIAARLVSGAVNGNLTFNGLTTNLSDRDAYLASTTRGTNATTKIRFVINDSTTPANSFSNNEIYVPNYASAMAHAVFLDAVADNLGTGNLLYFGTGLWNSATAITRVTLAPESSSFAQYSMATLYGIKNS